MRQILLVGLLALIFGAATVWLVQQDQGYLLIILGNTTIEMSFWTGAIIYLISCCFFVWLLLMLRWLLNAGGIRFWWHSRLAARQTSKTARGLLLFLNGDWQAAGRILSKSVANSSTPEVNLLYAAKAAAKNKQFDQSYQLLEKLKQQYPDAALDADLCLAEALIEDAKLASALALLLPLDNADKGVLRLLSQIYCTQSNWSELLALMPNIKRQSVFDDQSFNALQIDCYCGMLNTLGSDANLKDQQKVIDNFWSDIPRAFRKVPEVVAAYVDALVLVNCSDKGVSILAKALKGQWHGLLIERYGRIELSEATRQLALGEQWLLEHTDDAHLLLALGRICRRMGFLGKARDYMTSTIAIGPSAEAYYELAAVLHSMGDSKASSDMHRRGLAFAVELSVD